MLVDSVALEHFHGQGKPPSFRLKKVAVPAREPERPAVAPGGKGLQRTHTTVRDYKTRQDRVLAGLEMASGMG